MHLKGYILAADPSWIEASVSSYYDIVDELVVSYDRQKLGWTGQPILVDECLDRLKALDKDKKLRFIGGDFARLSSSAYENDTFQRQTALASVGKADWVLQIDTDEVVANPAALIAALKAVPKDVYNIEWPMRSLFQRTPDGLFLEVCQKTRQRQQNEYLAIAVRPDATFREPRYAFERLLRLTAPSCSMLRRLFTASHLKDEDAMLHFSWVRSEAQMQRKLKSWGHCSHFRVEKYYRDVWLAAPTRWREFRDFHPVHPRIWPALRETSLPYTPNW